jgi:hypothetical protein
MQHESFLAKPRRPVKVQTGGPVGKDGDGNAAQKKGLRAALDKAGFAYKSSACKGRKA